MPGDSRELDGKNPYRFTVAFERKKDFPMKNTNTTKTQSIVDTKTLNQNLDTLDALSGA